MENKMYVQIDYKNKELAKRFKAKWDSQMKSWYFINEIDKELYLRNVPQVITKKRYDNDILFLKYSDENRYEAEYLRYNYFHDNIWRYYGDTELQVHKNSLPLDTKIIILNIRGYALSQNFKLDNLPTTLEKIYLKKGNGFTEYIIENNLIKLPFGCEIIQYDRLEEIAELNKDCLYREYQLII